jgi:hypothetical protein
MPMSVTNSPEKIRRMEKMRRLESTHPRIAAHIKQQWAENGYPPTGPTTPTMSEEEQQRSLKASSEHLKKLGWKKD